MRYRVTVMAEILVDINGSGGDAIAIARTHVANDWVLRRREGVTNIGHFVVKGLSGEVTGARPYEGNKQVEGGNCDDSES